MADIPVHSIVSVSANMRPLFGWGTGSLMPSSNLKVAANSPVVLKSPDPVMKASVGALKNSESKRTKGKGGVKLLPATVHRAHKS